MKKISVLTKKQQYSAIVLSVVFSFFAVWMAVSGATTIGTNVSTGGTMAVSGLSTLAGFISSASSSVSGTLNVTGSLLASSTLQATGLSSLTGFISSASSTVSGTLNVTGALLASSTLQATGLSSLTGFISSASSSISSSLRVDTLGAATTSTAVEVNVDGRAGTSTVRALSAATARGGCIELGVPSGGSVRIYATTTASLNGTADGGLIVESGHCEE